MCGMVDISGTTTGDGTSGEGVPDEEVSGEAVSGEAVPGDGALVGARLLPGTASGAEVRRRPQEPATHRAASPDAREGPAPDHPRRAKPAGPEAERFREFVTERWISLLRTAYLLTGDHGHAEDLVQTALIRLHRHWIKVERLGSPEAYVRKVMFNLHTDWWRRLGSRERMVVFTADIDLPSSTDPYASFDLRDELWQALRRLPAKMRATLVLRYFEDLGEAETAQILGCSIGTVKSQTSRGLQRLQQSLTPRPSAAASPPADPPAETSPAARRSIEGESVACLSSPGSPIVEPSAAVSLAVDPSAEGSSVACLSSPGSPGVEPSAAVSLAVEPSAEGSSVACLSAPNSPPAELPAERLPGTQSPAERSPVIHPSAGSSPAIQPSFPGSSSAPPSIVQTMAAQAPAGDRPAARAPGNSPLFHPRAVVLPIIATAVEDTHALAVGPRPASSPDAVPSNARRPIPMQRTYMPLAAESDTAAPLAAPLQPLRLPPSRHITARQPAEQATPHQVSQPRQSASPSRPLLALAQQSPAGSASDSPPPRPGSCSRSSEFEASRHQSARSELGLPTKPPSSAPHRLGPR